MDELISLYSIIIHFTISKVANVKDRPSAVTRNMIDLLITAIINVVLPHNKGKDNFNKCDAFDTF